MTTRVRARLEREVYDAVLTDLGRAWESKNWPLYDERLRSHALGFLQCPWRLPDRFIVHEWGAA